MPEPGNPQALNRFAYAASNPVSFSDPSGHWVPVDEEAKIGARPTDGKLMLMGSFAVPPVVQYIWQEMVTNAQGPLAQSMSYRNTVARLMSCVSTALAFAAKSEATAIWASQVMDARAKSYAGPAAPYIASWDHKPVLKSHLNSWLEGDYYTSLGDRRYYFDIWSNMHYGFVGKASGFASAELTGGAGVEQVGSDLVTHLGGDDSAPQPSWNRSADNWLAGWDSSSDNAAIRLGISLWIDHGTQLRPEHVYLAVIQQDRLTSLPLGR